MTTTLRPDSDADTAPERHDIPWEDRATGQSDLLPEPITFEPADGRVAELAGVFEHAYDPRVTWLESLRNG